MHIVHLTWEYPPIVYGGLGRHVHALAAAQAAAGHQVTVVTQQSATADDEVRVLGTPTDGPFPYRLSELLTWVGHLDHGIGRAATGLHDVDLVHAHDWVVGRAGRFAAESLRCPLVATLHATEAGRHSGWLPDPVSRSVHLVEQWLVDEADSIIVCSKSMAEEVERAHHCDPRHLNVVPNGIETSGYVRRTSVPEYLLQGHPRITFVGRIEWEKGVFTAVTAMSQVVAEYPGARLRMVGTGGQVDAVRQAVVEAGLAEHVEMLGYVAEDVLADVYSSSDLVIAPSSYEPFGLVALEAAAMGVPLVVGDTGGLAEFVTDARGLRHRPQDPQDLARAIRQALGDRAATTARADEASAALRDYTWQRIAELTDEVYRGTQPRPKPQRALHVPVNPVL